MPKVEYLRTLEEKVAPHHTAVLVIDMQNDFCSEGGFVGQLGLDLSGLKRSMPCIRKVVDSARSHGIDVIHIRSHFDPEFLLPPMLERLERKKSKPYCVAGTWGADFVSELEPAPGEPVVTKHRYSGFYATELDMLLRARSVETVVLTGTATNNCVDGTGRDAFYNGYYVVMLSDATAAPTQALQAAALATADHAYAVIANADEVCKIWENSAGERR